MVLQWRESAGAALFRGSGYFLTNLDRGVRARPEMSPLRRLSYERID
jgi:hypothetical protein